MSIARFLVLGLIWALQSGNASGATIYRGELGYSLVGVGPTIEDAEADLRNQIEALAKVGTNLNLKNMKERARCSGGGYSASAIYTREPVAHGEQGSQTDQLVVCGQPSWESAMAAVQANCMRVLAGFKPAAHFTQCKPFPQYHDRFQTKERGFFTWFDSPKKPDAPKPEPKPQETVGTRGYDGRYAPDCTKIGLALDIHGENMTLSESGRVLFTQKGKLLLSYWGNTPPPGGEAGFSGKHQGDPAFELMRQGGMLFGNINPSKQLESLMAGHPLKGYRYCGLTCNSGKAEVSGGNIVCRR